MTTEIIRGAGSGGYTSIRADLTQELASITTQGGSYTATEDCILIGKISKGSAAAPAAIYLGDSDTNWLMLSYTTSTTLDQYTNVGRDDIGFAIPAGTKVRTRASYGLYDLHFYKIAR